MGTDSEPRLEPGFRLAWGKDTSGGLGSRAPCLYMCATFAPWEAPPTPASPFCVPAGECLVTGQSHFKSFDSRHFTFSGICQYLLAQDCQDHSFSIVIETVQVGLAGLAHQEAVRGLQSCQGGREAAPPDSSWPHSWKASCALLSRCWEKAPAPPATAQGQLSPMPGRSTPFRSALWPHGWISPVGRRGLMEWGRRPVS